MSENKEPKKKIRIRDNDGNWIWVDPDTLDEEYKFLHEEELKSFLGDSKPLNS